jgi:hypothetical protein
MEHQLEKKKSRARAARSLRANGPAGPITYYHLVISHHPSPWSSLQYFILRIANGAFGSIGFYG